MSLISDFKPLPLEELRRECAYMKAEGWRFVQMLAAVSDTEGNDLYYSFMKENELRNYVIAGVAKEQEVPSISDLFLASFVFENEARELFGVNMGPIAIDFAGAMYAPAESEPMTFMSPEQKEALDKQRKVNAAMAAKAAKEVSASDENPQQSVQASASAAGKGLTAAQRELIKQKIAELSPEKAAKLQAVLDREAQGSQELSVASEAEGNVPNAVLSAEPVVAAKIDVVVDAASEEAEPIDEMLSDERLDKMLSLMDEDRAKIVLDALRDERA